MSPFAGLRLLFIAGAVLLATHLEASADKRVALVIGNSTYQNVARLPNPARDADAIAQLFKAAGFDTVSLQQNVGNLDFKRAIRKFEEAAGDAECGCRSCVASACKHAPLRPFQRSTAKCRSPKV
jgi:Caspase domain